MHQEHQLISIQRYATQHKLSTFNVIKQINTGKLKTIKKDDEEFIIDETIVKTSHPKELFQMRRSEFEVNNKEEILALLEECEFGTLSMMDKDQPYGVPVNFAWWEEGIVFHGAMEGKKIDLLSKNKKASFSVVKPYAFIPSYFSGTTSACPATQFFGSVIINGTVEIILDKDQKAEALNALMQKLQPEKKYEVIKADNPIYQKMIAMTAVMKLIPNNLTCKLKIGQNLSDERQASLVTQLKERGNPLDILTAKIMTKELS
ncbi:MAG: pyridoxamine 5'-phosphate oxidase family protein [Campylobacteraceae bacterium]|nr:pyridoxamine 5'-phosphate oxidase family protein [Campylobacteraceae bacterium]